MLMADIEVTTSVENVLNILFLIADQANGTAGKFRREGLCVCYRAFQRKVDCELCPLSNLTVDRYRSPEPFDQLFFIARPSPVPPSVLSILLIPELVRVKGWNMFSNSFFSIPLPWSSTTNRITDCCCDTAEESSSSLILLSSVEQIETERSTTLLGLLYFNSIGKEIVQDLL